LAEDVTVVATNATITNATIEGKDSIIVVGSGSTIDSIAVNGENATITANAGAKVNDVVINANGATVAGAGTVTNVAANADNATVNTIGTVVKAAEGTSGVKAGDDEVASGTEETVGPPPSTGGGGGGGSTPDTTAPTFEGIYPAVLPGETHIRVIAEEGTFSISVFANDNRSLYELEIDHSLEGILPEFSVYASETDPYGGDEELFAEAGVTVAYNAAQKKWDINFGRAITDAFIDQETVIFYFVIKDTSGNTWGSMNPPTEANTFKYSLYDSVQAAINAADEGDVIVLNDDINLGSDDKDAVVVPTGKIVTLDLNGQTVQSSSGNWALKVETGAELTINDSAGEGKITNSAKYGEAIRCYGTLTIDGGTYEATHADGGYALIMSNRTNTSVYTCDVTINDRTFKGWIYNNGTDSHIKLTIHDGVFTRSIYLASAFTDATINGGTFSLEQGKGESVIEIDAGTLTIEDGTFTNIVDTSSNATAETSNNSSGAFKGVIVAVKPSGSKIGSYGSPVVVNINGGTYTNNQDDDAIVLANHTAVGNIGGGDIIVNISDGSINGNIAVYDRAGVDASTLNITGGAVSGNII